MRLSKQIFHPGDDVLVVTAAGDLPAIVRSVFQPINAQALYEVRMMQKAYPCGGFDWWELALPSTDLRPRLE